MAKSTNWTKQSLTYNVVKLQWCRHIFLLKDGENISRFQSVYNVSGMDRKTKAEWRAKTHAWNWLVPSNLFPTINPVDDQHKYDLAECR